VAHVPGHMIQRAGQRALALAMLILLVACSGGSAEASRARGQLLAPPVLVATWEPAQIDDVAEALGVHELAGAARCKVRLFSMEYATPGAHGEPGASASAALLLPQPTDNTETAETHACTGELPLLAYARGTEVDRNRTLASTDDFETSLLLAFFAAQGYAVVATDYLGYAGSDYPFHPYLHASSEASTVLDSLAAARTAIGDEAGRDVSATFLAGYSQGGHASMAAQRAAESSDAGNQPRIAAAAHLAGLYDLDALLQERQAWPGYRLIVPFLLTSWQKVYGDIYLQPLDAFRPPYAARIANLLPAPGASLADLIAAGLLPGGTPAQARDALMQPAFLRVMQEGDAGAPVRVAARANSLMDWQPRAPVLLCGAHGDRIVPPRVHQLPLAARWRAQGVRHLASVDVGAQIAARHGAQAAAAPQDAAAPGYAAAWGTYHGLYEPPFCLAAARAWFDRAR